MHHANLSKSRRLQRVAIFLSDGVARTTRQIIRGAHVCAVNSIASELRANGVLIDCQRRGDKWFYKLGTA